MSNIIYIFFPWFCYLISLIFLFIYYIFPLWIYISADGDVHSTQDNIKKNKLMAIRNGNIILLLLYLINTINYYNIFNNVDIFYQGFIIYPSLIIMFCFLLLSVFLIIII